MPADGLAANLTPKAVKILTALHLICLGLVMGAAAGVLASLRLMYTRGDNLDHLTAHDQVKFVVCSRADYEWARTQLREHGLDTLCEVLFSPAWGLIEPVELADWILADRLPVRLQLQLHKLLWDDTPGH